MIAVHQQPAEETSLMKNYSQLYFAIMAGVMAAAARQLTLDDAIEKERCTARIWD